MAELRKGYTMNGRTLRPARVTVSRQPSDEDEALGGSEESEEGL